MKIDRKPTRQTETRHSSTGKTCHHFMHHRLTCDEYDALRERAAGCCEICGTPEAGTGGRRLVVDHFENNRIHQVRGLLCDACNVVMSCLDGKKEWGANRAWEAAARDYDAAAWWQPTPEQAEDIAATRSRNRRRIRHS